jgi:AcrR family transcriptional regulator
MGRKHNLSRDDWIEAALNWIAEHGVASLAVEPLARSLGVTKGGFYWCFASRDELLEAVLERWGFLGTDEVIRLVGQTPSAPAQVKELLSLVLHRIRDTPEALRIVRIQHALGCAGTDPRVAPVLERVTAVRIAFLEKILKGSGLPAKVARQRALLAHASYIGLVQLLATNNTQAIAGIKSGALVETYLTMLLAPAG